MFYAIKKHFSECWIEYSLKTADFPNLLKTQGHYWLVIQSHASFQKDLVNRDKK